MIETTTVLLFIGATALLVATPGPVVGLIMAETLNHGMRFGFMVSLGAGTIAIIFLGLYIAGAAPLFAALENYFDLIRYLGVIYLLYLGVTTIAKSGLASTDLHIHARKPFDAYKSALIITASSPKTILFFAAFFPQFIDETGDVTQQLMILSAVFLIVSVSMDSCWVLIAGRARTYIAKPGMYKRLNIVSGSILCIAASVLLII